MIFREYLKVNLNKAITLIFSILFSTSFYILKGSTMLTLYAAIILLLLNVFNFMSHRKLSAIFEALIYEGIAIIGIYHISWYYALLFILVAEVFHVFRSRVVLATVIIANSVLYTFFYLEISNNAASPDFKLWKMALLLVATILLSIYFIKSEENCKEQKAEETKNHQVDETLEQKYLELLKEHQDILLLKEVMDLSNHPVEIKDLARKINQLLLRNFENIDYSTIFLFDDKRKEFKIVTSNVSVHFHKSLCNLEQFEYFDDVVANKHVKMLSSEYGLTYPTARERRIGSAFCVPLHTHKELIGLILMESQDFETFKEIDVNKFNLIRYNISLILENKLWVERIEKMALVDGLTGVYNRNYLFDFLNQQVVWHKENTKPMSLVLFDVDHFKKFNDTYGHLFGDLVLKEISSLVKTSIREMDLVARYGGEEFIIVLVDTDAQIAKERIEEIRLKIQAMTVKNEEGVEAKVTVSFGIAEFGQNSYNINIKDLIERADQALYKSKQEGRNRVTIYNS